MAGLGRRAAVALNPSTPADAVAHVLDLVEMVLVMTVNPGFGGQAYIATMEPKIAALRALIDERGTTSTSRSTAASARHRRRGRGAGANVLVAGSSLYPIRKDWSTR